MSVVFDDKSAIICFIALLQIMCLFFSLPAFKLFVLSLVYSSVNTFCQGSIPFVFVLPGIHVFLGCLGWHFPPNLGNFFVINFLFVFFCLFVFPISIFSHSVSKIKHIIEKNIFTGHWGCIYFFSIYILSVLHIWNFLFVYIQINDPFLCRLQCSIFKSNIKPLQMSDLNKIFIYFILFLFIIFFKANLFIYFWLCWVFVSVRGLSLVVATGGHSIAVRGPLTIVASLVAEHRLQMRRLSNCGSQA